MTSFYVEPNVPYPQSIRQTIVGRLDACPHSAYLALRQQQPGELHLGTHAQNRGILFHMFAEQAAQTLINQGETMMPGDVARELMESVLKDYRPTYPVPQKEVDACRAMAFNWGEHFALSDAWKSIGVERKLHHEFEEKLPNVHGTLDLIVEYGNGSVPETEVYDYKTGLYVPSQEEYEKGFQGIFYAWLAWQNGKPLPITHIQVYPRHVRPQGGLVTREAQYDELTLADFEQDVEDLMRHFKDLHGGAWFPAVPGDHCFTCPAQHLCPIPEEYRPIQIIDESSATAVAQRADRIKAQARELDRGLKAWAQENGSIPLDGDYELGFTVVESEVVADKQGLKAEIEAEGKNTGDFFTTRTSTRFGKRKIDD